MRRNSMFRRWTLAVLLAPVLGLVLVAGALAVLPHAGKLYTGYTAGPGYHGFTAPVSFTVSRNGRQLLAFKWAGGGCIGLGGPGNAYTSADLNYKVGTINVSRAGTFSVKNVKWTSPVRQPRTGRRKVTISTVTGRFKTATTATGTIHFTQQITKKCSGTTTFTASAGPAPGGFHKTSPANSATVQSTAPTLSWTASRNATDYQYCLATINNGACSGPWRSTRTSTRVTLSGLRPGTTYYWQAKASSVHGTVAADNGSVHAFTVSSAGIGPEAGSWAFTSLSGPVTGYGGSLNSADSATATGIFFTVNPDRATVSGFGFNYKWSGPGNGGNVCTGQGTTVDQATAPIAGGQFSPPASNTWSWSSPTDYGFRIVGNFDSPTTAHGTAQLRVSIANSYLCQRIGYATTGLFSWTATRQP
jgi:hypothetical protein